jgi:DNA repair photolyase
VKRAWVLGYPCRGRADPIRYITRCELRLTDFVISLYFRLMGTTRSSRIELGRPDALKGRGTPDNPANRFEVLHYEASERDEVDAGVTWIDDDEEEEGAASPRTLYLRDASRSILSHNKSPDVPFDASVNPYRGCEHGCVYCYARPSHEYLGFSAGLDFETKILVKPDAPSLLRKALASPRWTPQVIGMCGVTDPYQPIERRARITRGCLEVLRDFRNPVGLISKNALVARDVDLLAELAEHQCVSVTLSITTLRSDLHRVMEPRASHPIQRLRAVEVLARAGVPVGVSVAPVIPGLTDEEIPAILQAARDAGAQRAGFIVLRLPFGVRELFSDWLERHFPERAKKVLSQVRDTRGGNLNDWQFGSRMRGQGVMADQIEALFRVCARKLGFSREFTPLSAENFRKPASPQLDLFD